MPRAAHRIRPRLPALAVLVAGVLIGIGALIWFVPYLTRTAQPVAEVPTPSALFALSEFSLAPGGRACLGSVTVDPHSDLAQFGLRPARPAAHGGPPVDLVLRAPGYRATVHVPGGYMGGSVTLPMTPPARALIGTACFANRGRTSVLLAGTTEARTISRSQMRIDGQPVVGDIALTFLDSRPQSLLDRLGEIFARASNLTDRMVPVWLIWILALLVAFGVPVGILAAFHRALREDQTTAAS